MEEKEKKAPKIRQRDIWRKFFKMLRLAHVPVWALIFYVVMNMVSIYIGLTIPQLYGAFYSGDVSEDSVASVILSEIASSVVVCLIFLVRYYVNAKIDCSFRNAVWGKVLSLPESYFDRQNGSSLISRITSDAESLRSFLLDVLISELLSLSTAIATIASMTTIRKELAVIMAVLIPIILVAGFLLGRLKMAVGNLVKQELAELTEYMSSQLASLGVIKAYNAERKEEENAEQAISSYFRAARAQKVVELIQDLITTLIGFLPQISLILIGIRLLADRSLTVAGWVTFLSYATSLITFFNEKTGVWTSIKEVQGQLIRVADIMDQKSEKDIRGKVENIESGDLRFEDVSFSYDETPALNHISFTIPKNGITLIAGPSGCGKSTSLKLLERIYPCSSGRILCGDTDISEGNLLNWRRKMAVVAQEAPMLSGILRENLLYGSGETIPDEEIIRAADDLGCGKLLREKGLDCEVGQFGSSLSGGQRQIFSVLRAKLQKKEIIVLDEPTASLDFKTSEEVLRALSGAASDATVVMVEHSRSAVDCCSHIVLFSENGTVKEGTREELLGTDAFLQQMYAHGEEENDD